MIIDLLVNHLRAEVFDSSTYSPPVGEGMNTTPEIGDLHIVVIVEQNVLQFDIPMHDAANAEVADSLKQLLHDGGNLLIAQSLFKLLNFIKEKVLGMYRLPLGQCSRTKYTCLLSVK